MLTVQQNERLTRVGPGTPMGNLLRRYWHPFAASGELGGHGGHRDSGTPSMNNQKPTKAIRLLGEDLVLYRDLQGRLGLIDRFCAHRRVDLSYGIPEEHGLRCMYHGWMYNETGQCIEQPFEETVHPVSRPGFQPGSSEEVVKPSRPDFQSGSSEVVIRSFKDKVKLKGYPVQELGGLLFAYLGPQPAPLLPRWDILVEDRHVLREAFISELPANWLQCMENSVDSVHLEWLHGVYGAYAARQRGYRDAVAESLATYGRHKEIGFDVFERGITKRRVYGGFTKDSPKWTVGHPLIFPNILQQGGGGRFFLQYRVPIDDTHTWHVELTSYWLPDDVEVPPPQERVPYQYMGLYEEEGGYGGHREAKWSKTPYVPSENGTPSMTKRLRTNDTIAQDQAAWILQGPIARREAERLGQSDVGLILYRKLLEEQMRIVEDGGEPMNVFRDAAANVMLHNDQEGWGAMGMESDVDEIARYGSQLREVIKDTLARTTKQASQRFTA